MTTPSLPPANLASAFTAPAPPPPALRLPPRAKPEPVAVEETTLPVTTSREQKPKKNDAVRTTPRKPAAAAATKTMFSLPTSTHARMRQCRHSTGSTFAEQILTALEANAEHLEQLVHAHLPQIEQGPLFERLTKPRVTEPKSHITVYGLTTSHLDVIDRLVQDTQSPSRSALITAALEKWLAP